MNMALILQMIIYYAVVFAAVPLIWNLARNKTKGTRWSKMLGPILYCVLFSAGGGLIVWFFIPCN